MTTFHQVRALLRLDREDLARSAHRQVRGTVGLFFKPPNDRTPRNPKRSFESTQTAPLLIGPQNLFPSFVRISRKLRIIATLPSTGATAIFLFTVWCDSILHECCIAAMAANDRGRVHGVNPFSSAC